jgi:hypothetical protein
MRLTFRVTTSGDRWHVDVPRVTLADCYPKDEQGRETFDEAAFRRQVANTPRVMLSSDDRGPVCAFAAMLIASLGEWMDDADKFDGSDRMKRVAASMSSRVKREKFAAVRVDLSNALTAHKGGTFQTVRVRIRHADLGNVGNPFQVDCAMMVADFCRCYSRMFVERGDPPLIFSPETLTLLDELHDRTEREREAERVKTANIMRHKCERLVNGFCSPCKFDCPHFKAGKCVDI